MIISAMTASAMTAAQKAACRVRVTMELLDHAGGEDAHAHVLVSSTSEACRFVDFGENELGERLACAWRELSFFQL